MHSLPVFLRLEGRAVILVGEGETGEAKRRLLERAGAIIVGEDEGAAVALVALAEPDATVSRLKARGILINVADRPDLCDFTLPAIVDRDPVIIAIGTGGKSAGLAKALRQRIEAMLPAKLGALAEGLFTARGKLREALPTPDARRHALDAALSESAVLDPLDEDAHHRVEAWASSPEMADTSALIRIAIPSDDPDELSLRAARLLGRADHVFHAPDIAPVVLLRARADAARVACTAPPDPPPPGLSLFLERP